MAKAEREVRQRMHDEFNSLYDRSWCSPLKAFGEQVSHRKAANQYARENPHLTGFITFPIIGRGGWHFFRIENGKATTASAFQMFLEKKYGIMNWWDY
jgi:hypothetical protein